MTHKISKVDDTIPKGDSVILTFKVTEDGNARDITNDSIVYKLKRTGTTIADSDSDSDVNVTKTGTTGEFEVKFDQGASSGYPDHVDEIIRIADQSGDRISYEGHLEFEEL